MGGRNGNDDRSYLSREFRSRITSLQAPGGPNRPETSKNESKTNRSTQKSFRFRIRGGRAAELPPAHTRRLQLGGVTCGTLDRRSRAPDMRHYLLMACRVGGPNLVANSAGFEIYKSVLRKSTVLYAHALLCLLNFLGSSRTLGVVSRLA